MSKTLCALRVPVVQAITGGGMLYEKELSGRIIRAAIEVHRALGPGLLESAYQVCLARELALQDIPFQREVPLPVDYKGIEVDCG